MNIPTAPLPESKPACGVTLFGHWRVAGENVGPRQHPLARDQKWFLLRGRDGEEIYILADRLRTIIDNPPTRREIAGHSVTLTYEDRRNACISLVRRYGVPR